MLARSCQHFLSIFLVHTLFMMPAETHCEGQVDATKSKPELVSQRQDEPYSAFTTTEKWCIVAMTAFASWVSNLSTFIYLPVLPALSDAFAVSVGQINLTITVYMAVAAVAPTLIGDTGDVMGRRVAYVISLGLFLIACVCLGGAGSYSQLLGFRVLQALGQSGKCDQLPKTMTEYF